MRIISGGQSGADRGGLDAAIALGLDHGGYCPRGRRAEDGIIPACYQLTELPTDSYAVRTRRNLEIADAVMLVGRSRGGPGTALTQRLAAEAGKLCLPLEPPASVEDLVAARAALAGIATLMVAGPRESRYPGLQAATKSLVLGLLDPSLDDPY
jgi:hypothetical protein